MVLHVLCSPVALAEMQMSASEANVWRGRATRITVWMRDTGPVGITHLGLSENQKWLSPVLGQGQLWVFQSCLIASPGVYSGRHPPKPKAEWEKAEATEPLRRPQDFMETASIWNQVVLD